MNIGIVGCGWLGLPLAQRLIQKGWKVWGTTTRPERLPILSDAGINEYLLRLTPGQVEGKLDWLSEIDALVINVPPGIRKGGEASSYLEKLRPFLEALEGARVPRVLFVSSTSVFGAHQGEVKEDSPCLPEKESGKALVAAEQMVQEGPWRSTILRFGGLLGEDRHPVQYLAGRSNLANGNAPVNLIHRKDCIGLIEAILDQSAWGRIFHGVADLHPTRQDYYRIMAKKLGMSPPEFLPGHEGALVRNFAAASELGYSFSYPDPFDMMPTQWLSDEES